MLRIGLGFFKFTSRRGERPGVWFQRFGNMLGGQCGDWFGFRPDIPKLDVIIVVAISFSQVGRFVEVFLAQVV